MWLNVIGLDGNSSLLKFVLLQRGGNATQNSGCRCPLGVLYGWAIHSAPVVVASANLNCRHRCDLHFAAF